MTRKEARIRLITKREELMHKYMFEEAEVITMAIEALKADTVEVVRCGECEHGIVETGSRFPFEGNITCELDHVKRQWFKNDFCSYGERSEE